MKKAVSLSYGKKLTLCCSFLLLAVFPHLNAFAADIKVDIDTMFLAETMLVNPGSNQLNGTTQEFSVPDKLLLGIPLQYEVVWDEQTDKIKIPPEQVVIVDEKGESAAALGEMNYYSGLKTMFNGLNDSRPSNWKEKGGKPRKAYPVFAVSAPGAKYTLKIGEKEVPITVPEKKDAIGPHLIAHYTVKGATRVDQLSSKLQVGKTDFMTTFRPMTGSFLAVQLLVEPTPPTRFESEHFYWNTSWFALMDENGNFSPIAGEIFFDKLSDNVSHNLSKGSAGWRPKDVTLHFAVGKQAQNFTLYCLGKPVADIKLP